MNKSLVLSPPPDKRRSSSSSSSPSFDFSFSSESPTKIFDQDFKNPKPLLKRGRETSTYTLEGADAKEDLLKDSFDMELLLSPSVKQPAKKKRRIAQLIEEQLHMNTEAFYGGGAAQHHHQEPTSRRLDFRVYDKKQQQQQQRQQLQNPSTTMPTQHHPDEDKENVFPVPKTFSSYLKQHRQKKPQQPLQQQHTAPSSAPPSTTSTTTSFLPPSLSNIINEYLPNASKSKPQQRQGLRPPKPAMTPWQISPRLTRQHNEKNGYKNFLNDLPALPISFGAANASHHHHHQTANVTSRSRGRSPSPSFSTPVRASEQWHTCYKML